LFDPCTINIKKGRGGDGARTHSLAGGLPCWNEGSFDKHVAICVLTKIHSWMGATSPWGSHRHKKKEQRKEKWSHAWSNRGMYAWLKMTQSTAALETIHSSTHVLACSGASGVESNQPAAFRLPACQRRAW